MKRTEFIRKWLGNKEKSYTEQFRDEMLDDLNAVIDSSVKNCNLPIVSNNEVIMKKKKQRELIQSIIKSDEKDDIYSEEMVCDCKKEWSEWEWKHNKCRKCGGIIEY